MAIRRCGGDDTCRSGGGGEGSNSTPSSQSSTNSSQDSLHKPAPKKKGGGLKTSIGRIFSKKDKMATKDSPVVVPRGYHTLPNPHRSSTSRCCFIVRMPYLTRCALSFISAFNVTFIVELWPVNNTSMHHCERSTVQRHQSPEKPILRLSVVVKLCQSH